MVAWIILIATITFFIIGFICKKDLFAWIWFGCDILFILWLTYFAKYFFEPPTKAYKFEVNFNNFDSIIEYLDQNVSKIGFKRYYNFDLKKAVIYYRLKQKQLSYFIIVNRDKILDNEVNTLSAIDDIKKATNKNKEKNNVKKIVSPYTIDKENEKKIPKSVIIGIIIALLCVAIYVVVYFVTKDKDKKDDNDINSKDVSYIYNK